MNLTSCLNKLRTSYSLNEGLPIKWPENVSKNMIFLSVVKGSWFSPRFIHKEAFHIGQVPIKIWVKTMFLLKYFPFAYSFSFTLYSSYKQGMFGQRGCSKTNYYKNPLVTNFVQTCS